MIITLQDRSEIYVSKERGEVLKNALIDGTAPEYIAIGEDTVIRKSFIVKLTAGGQNPERDESRLIAQPEISDEQRALNIKKLAKIKADFNKKRLAKAKAK